MFCFYKKHADSYHLVFIGKKLKMLSFTYNLNIFAIWINKLMNNIVKVNIKYIHIFSIKKKRDKYIYNIKISSDNRFIDLNYIN